MLRYVFLFLLLFLLPSFNINVIIITIIISLLLASLDRVGRMHVCLLAGNRDWERLFYYLDLVKMYLNRAKKKNDVSTSNLFFSLSFSLTLSGFYFSF